MLTHGSRRLWLAVLEQAINDYVCYRNDTRQRYRRLWNDARDWLFDESPADTICAVLGLDLAYLRRGLRDLQTWQDVRLDVLRHNEHKVVDVTTFNELRRKAA